METGDPLFWIVAVVAAAMVGLSKGGLPAVAMISVPLLALVMPPLAAAGLLLPVFIISDGFGLWVYRRDYDLTVLAITVPAALVGIGIGWATASLVPERWIALMIGLIGTAFALNGLLRDTLEGPPRRPRLLPGWFWGTLSGLTSFVSHSGGTPFQVYVLPLRLEKMTFAGTSTIAFAIINAAKLPPYWALGMIDLSGIEVALLLAIPAAAAVFLGIWLVRVLPQRLFYRLVLLALLAVSLQLLWSNR